MTLSSLQIIYFSNAVCITDQKIGIEGQLMEISHRSERTSPDVVILGSSTSSLGTTGEDLERGVPERAAHVRMKEKTIMPP